MHPLKKPKVTTKSQERSHTTLKGVAQSKTRPTRPRDKRKDKCSTFKSPIRILGEEAMRLVRVATGSSKCKLLSYKRSNKFKTKEIDLTRSLKVCIHKTHQV